MRETAVAIAVSQDGSRSRCVRRLTQVSVLDILSRFPLRLDNIMTLFCKILNKHFLQGLASVRDIRNRRSTVATAMTNVALLEHCTISSSSWMIFFIRDTVEVSMDSNNGNPWS